MPPPRAELQRDQHTDWSQYSHPVVLMIMRGPYWDKSSQIAFTRQELRAMIIPQLNAILDRYGIRKTPTKKDLVIDRIIEELIENHDPWLLRSQKCWRSSEPLFWAIGHAPREDDVTGPPSAVGHPAPSQADHSVRFEVDTVIPSDSVSQIGSRRGPQGGS